ncbi:MAG: nitroreductase [Actinomycetia bacterium]|nr:nitroreductase [Actinomycetes bacterium]MCP4962525.1 nitroreductase [Actinomycetes bacterium]
MEFDLSQTDTLLTTTRAVRKRLDLERDVPDDVILECLQLAIQAPTGSNLQGWRWLVVRDPAKKQALADIYNGAGGEYFDSRRETVDSTTQTGRVVDSALYLADHMAEVPVLLVPMIVGRGLDGTTAAAAGLMGSIMPAVWSFQLALRSRGLGTCLTTIHLHREEEAAALLGIPEEVTQCALLPVAYTVGTEFKAAGRGPVSDITYLDTYGSPILG